MLLGELEYVRPSTLDEAIEHLSRHDNARVIAGGQTLINVMKTRFAAPDVLVDLATIDGLDRIDVAADGAVTLGAMSTYDTIEHSEALRRVRPVLGQVAAAIADQQVRNRGTIGGNICAADPTNHFPPLVTTLDASLTMVGPDGERTVGSDDFFVGVYETAVGEDEILTAVSIPAPAPGSGDGFASLTIGKDGTGIVNASASVRVTGVTEEARIAIGCVGAQPVRAEAAENALVGEAPTEESVRRAVQGLGASLEPPSDVHASADYRRHIAEVMAARATVQAITRAWEES